MLNYLEGPPKIGNGPVDGPDFSLQHLFRRSASHTFPSLELKFVKMHVVFHILKETSWEYLKREMFLSLSSLQLKVTCSEDAMRVRQ